MADEKKRQFVLSARPEVRAKESDFALVETDVPTPGKGQVLLRNTLISVDPYQRNLMGNSTSEMAAIAIGNVMPGPTVAIVEESQAPDFALGDHVQTWSGWQDYVVSDRTGLRRLDPDAAPVSTALGVLRHTGLAAWLGMGEFLAPAPGMTNVVTAAADPVSPIAAQIAKLPQHSPGRFPRISMLCLPRSPPGGRSWFDCIGVTRSATRRFTISNMTLIWRSSERSPRRAEAAIIAAPTRASMTE